MGAGSIFNTTSKSDAKNINMEEIKDYKAVSIPVLGIGGINKGNIHLLKGSGLDGIAVISAILAKENVGEATKIYTNFQRRYLVKAAIFDLDGTLLDSMWLWGNLADNYLLSIGIEPPKDLCESLKDLTLKEACFYMKEKFNIKSTIDEINRDIENY